MNSRTILKFSSIVILAQAVLTIISGVILAAGSSSLNGTEYESMIGATIALAAVAIAESVFRGIAAFVGLKCCKPGAGTKAAFVFGILMIALDATGVINTLISNAQSAPASMIALAMSGLYLFSVMKIRKENSSENCSTERRQSRRSVKFMALHLNSRCEKYSLSAKENPARGILFC